MPYQIFAQKDETCTICLSPIPQGAVCHTNYENSKVICDDCHSLHNQDHYEIYDEDN